MNPTDDPLRIIRIHRPSRRQWSWNRPNSRTSARKAPTEDRDPLSHDRNGKIANEPSEVPTVGLDEAVGGHNIEVGPSAREFAQGLEALGQVHIIGFEYFDE